MNTGRAAHSATLLPSGKVLVAGGDLYLTAQTSAEIYDPGSDTWTAVPSLSTARYGHAATLLPNGKVLVAGGDGEYHYRYKQRGAVRSELRSLGRLDNRRLAERSP